MELEERLSYLENVRDWQGLVEELEKGIGSSAQNADKASTTSARPSPRDEVSRRREGAQALSGRVQAESGARSRASRRRASVYWDLGKLNMVQKLLELELKTVQDGAARERPARRARRRALRPGRLREGDGDVRARARRERRQERRGQRVPRGRAGRRATVEGPHVSRSCSRRTTRATRRARRARSPARGAHRAALRARTTPRACSRGRTRPTRSNKQAAALYEGLLAEQGRFDTLEQTQQQASSDDAGAKARGDAGAPFGTRWVSRHQNVEVGHASSSRRRSSTIPQNEGAFYFLREAYGKKARRLGSRARRSPKKPRRASRTATAPSCSRRPGTIAWRQLGNLIRARSSFERLSAVSPGAPAASRVRGPDRRDARSRRTASTRRRRGARGRRRAARRDRSPRPSRPRPPPVVAPRSRRDEPAPAPPRRRAPLPPRRSPPRRRRRAAPRRPPSTTAKVAELRAMAEKQEGAKRYNEYVKTLARSSPTLVGRSGREGRRSTRRPPSSTSTQVREPGRGREGLRGDPRHRSRATRQADRIPAADVREAPRLGEAPRSAAARGRAHAARRRRARRSSSRSRSSRPSGSRSPRSASSSGNEVIANDADERRGARAPSRGLYERAKDFEQARERAREAGRGHVRRNGQRSRCSTKLGTHLRRAAEQRRGRRRRLAAAPRARSRTIGKRAGSAEEEVPRARPLGRPRGLLRRERQVGRVHPRPRAARGEGDRRPQPKIWPALQDRPALGATRSRSSIARRRPTRRCSSSTPKQPRRPPKRSSRSTRQANNAKALANAIEVKLAPRAGPDAKLELFREVAGLYEGKVREPQKAFERYLSAFELAPGDEQAIEDVERAAKATGRLGRASSRRTSKAIDDGRSRRRSRRSAITLRLRLGRVLVDEVKRDRRSARAVPRRLRGRRRERRGDRRARAALPRRRRASPSSSASTRRSAISRPTPDEKKADHLRDRRALRERDQGRRTARSTRTCQVLEDEPMDAQALAALDVLYRRARALGAVRRGPAPAHRARRRRDGAHRSQVPPRRDAREAPRRCRRARSRTTARSSSSTRARGRARGARGDARERDLRAGGGRDPRGDLRGARRLGEADSARSRSCAAAEGDIEQARRAPPQGRAHQRPSA